MGAAVAVGVASVTDVAVGADVGVGAAVAVGVASVTDVAAGADVGVGVGVGVAPALQAAATARPHVTRVSPSRHILRELLSAFKA